MCSEIMGLLHASLADGQSILPFIPQLWVPQRTTRHAIGAADGTTCQLAHHG